MKEVIRRNEYDDVANTLIAAAKIIQKYGWRKYSYGNTKDGFCMSGAINYACGITSQIHMPDDFRLKVNQSIAGDETSLTRENDYYTGSQAHAVKKLMSWARKARSLARKEFRNSGNSGNAQAG